LTDFENADHLNHPSFRYLFLEMRDIANQKAHLSQVLLAFYVGITTKPTPVWSTEPLRVLQDLNLLNPSLLIPTWFPVELSWLVLAQTLYMELEAPPVPRTPLCCIFPGPRGPIIPGFDILFYKNRLNVRVLLHPYVENVIHSTLE